MRSLLPLHYSKRSLLIGVCVIIAVSLSLALIRFFAFPQFPTSKAAPPVISDEGLEKFLLRSYWQRPIALQGVPPPSYSTLEASLRPEACGSCHKQQYNDWKESLHSRAMGPGPWGQIIDLASNSLEEAVQCMTCHAPLSEQLPALPRSTSTEAAYEKNPHLDQVLQSRGITCAACHVRQHQRFGPPKIKGDAANTYPRGMPNHGGFQATPYFERAEFCKDCHQFDPDNALLVNGKPIQDTYGEWKNSIWGKGGAACQDCHMPLRRHLWRGIHDRDWVKNGVQINANVEQSKSRAKQKIIATLEITNSAVGHKFPTYTTPKVFFRASLLDASGKNLPGTLKQQTIGWDVRFENGEWKEYFDTRISPGATFKQSFEWAPSDKVRKLRVWVEVHPDHFYHVYFYPAYLKRTDLSIEGRQLVKRALEESGKTPYVLFEHVFPLKNSSAAER